MHWTGTSSRISPSFLGQPIPLYSSPSPPTGISVILVVPRPRPRPKPVVPSGPLACSQLARTPSAGLPPASLHRTACAGEDSRSLERGAVPGASLCRSPASAPPTRITLCADGSCVFLSWRRLNSTLSPTFRLLVPGAKSLDEK